MTQVRKYLFFLFIFPLCLYAQVQTNTSEWSKIHYNVQTNMVVSTGKHAPFWLVSNRHGLSSLENNNANLSVGLFRNFDRKHGFTWAYGAEIAGAWNYTSPCYIQQLYADIKYNCWELSVGSKERWSEGKHHTLSGGGLTFSPNARPIPQIRFGINEYTTAQWLFNQWVQVKGHFSYGRHTDDAFQRTFTAYGVRGTRYAEDILFHEKTAFMKVGNRRKSPFSVEIGLEMYSQFGGKTWEKHPEGDILRYNLPHSYKEYIKAFIPMTGGSNSPEIDQLNVNGNILGSWHFAACYEKEDWYVKAYYEHFYEDHSGLFGLDYHYNQNGEKGWVTYLPWRDGLYGLEIAFPKNKFVQTFVYEYITSRDQSGPILHNPGGNTPEQTGGADLYYNHTFYLSWQHWGMAMCNPHILSPSYNNNHNLTMPNQRIRSHHIGFNGKPTNGIDYRIMLSWSKHWGSIVDPLPNPLTQLSMMGEITYRPQRRSNWLLIGALAFDRSELIGNNFGSMFTIRHTGWIKTKK